MEKGKDYARDLPNKMGKPPYHDAQPPRMGRSAGKGKSGNTFRVPNGAKYGTGEGAPPTRMGRSGGSGKKGNTFRIPANGPAKSSRKDTGGNSSMGKTYGVGGVSSTGKTNYGGS